VSPESEAAPPPPGPAPGATLEAETRAFADVVARLRSKDGGCPWDLAQTRETLRTYILEEAYEAVEAIDGGDAEKIREELGDLLFQVVLQSQVASETGLFDLAAVTRGIREKIVRRHPHVFGAGRAKDASEVLVGWEESKRRERAAKGEQGSALSGVPSALPALSRAQKVQERAGRVGFDWPSADGVLEKLDEETRELREALASGDRAAIQHELGDLLFTVVNLARKSGEDAEDALRAATARFERRFRSVESGAHSQGRAVSDLSVAEMDALWEDAKRRE
jgi:MazG family protein